MLRHGNGPCVQDSDRTEGFELGKVEDGGDLQETLHGVRCSLHRENAAKSRGEIEGTPAACREERSERFCDCRACVEDWPHNRLGQAQVIDYEQRWGAGKINDSLPEGLLAGQLVLPEGRQQYHFFFLPLVLPAGPNLVYMLGYILW